ncbi:MAG: FeoA family protein [Anaerovoracaceae bacterium]
MRSIKKMSPGEQGIIVDVGGDKRFLSRITSIGLTLGCKVKMLRNERKLPLLLYGRDTVVALDREDCEKLMVEVIP